MVGDRVSKPNARFAVPSSLRVRSRMPSQPENTLNHLICIVDDDASLRRAVHRLVAGAGYCVESFASAEEYLARDRFEGAICLVLDARVPRMAGLSLQETVASGGGHEQIVFISTEADVETCVQAMRSGAVDFLVKPISRDQLVAAVERALERSELARLKRLETEAAQKLLDTLTSRELQVMRLVIAGLLNKQIAAEIGTVEKTVKAHRGQMMSKLGLDSVVELVRFAERAGISPLRPKAGNDGH